MPEREGHSFDGWWTKKSGGTKVKSSTKITKSVTFYAHWKVNKYKVRATSSNTSHGTVSGAGTKTFGSKVTLKATPKKGYVFVKWVDLLEPDEPWPSVTKCRQPTLSFKVPAEDIYVRAVFAKASEDAAPVLTVEDGYDWYLEDEPDRNVGIEVDSLSYPTVTATGLPSGMLFSRYGDKTDCSYIIMPFALSLMKPGVYTVKITAKNRAGKSAAKTIRIVTPNTVKAINDGLIAGLETSVHAPYVFSGGMKAKSTLANLGIEVFATNGWKLASVTGLPTGLSWNGSAIVGAASKTGLYTVTFTMKKTVKTGKKTKTYTSTASATFKVEALLPDALAGVYNGFANTTVEDAEDNADGEGEGDGESVDEETHGVYTPLVDGGASAVKVTVATSGKITANVCGVALSGNGFDAVSNGVYSVTLKKTQKFKKGFMKGKSRIWEVYLEIDTAAPWDGTQLVGLYTTRITGIPSIVNAWISAQRRAFGDGDEAKDVADAVAAFGTKGTVKFTPKAVKGEAWAYDLVAGGTAVSAKAKADGTVTLSGKIGKTKISGTATLEVSAAEGVAVEAADPKATSCADEVCGPTVLRRTATARFFSGGFVIEIVYTLDDGAVVGAAGRVWRK